MAINIELTQEQRDNQAAIITRLFGLPDASEVQEGFTLDGRAGGALLKVTLVKLIDEATALALLNGTALPADTPD